MSKLGLLVTYARTQRSIAYMTAGAAAFLRCGVWQGKEAWQRKRFINFQKTQIEQRASCMRDVVKCRLEDVEENRNQMLCTAIDRLTTARLNRIEYAGRMLPVRMPALRQKIKGPSIQYCPECNRDCEIVELAMYRTWCQQCWDKHVVPLPFPENGGHLEKNSDGVWQWVAA